MTSIERTREHLLRGIRWERDFFEKEVADLHKMEKAKGLLSFFPRFWASMSLPHAESELRWWDGVYRAVERDEPQKAISAIEGLIDRLMQQSFELAYASQPNPLSEYESGPTTQSILTGEINDAIAVMNHYRWRSGMTIAHC